MSQMKKHSFEAVSLLTAANGMLAATIIPAINQPDWIVPSSLILDSLEYSEEAHSANDNELKRYSWQQQQVATFCLLPTEQAPDKVVILEGNAADQRLALLTKGELRHIEVSISEVQDSALPEQYCASTNDIEDSATTNNSAATDHLVSEDSISSYLFQALVIDQTVYIVADLDKIAYQLTAVS